MLLAPMMPIPRALEMASLRQTVSVMLMLCTSDR